MAFKQTIASIGLTGYFGAVFFMAAPPLSIGLMVTCGVISAALGFGIVGASKWVGNFFSPSGPAPHPAAPPHPDNPYPIPETAFNKPSITHRRKPATRPVFQNQFSRKPAVHEINPHRIESSLPVPTAPSKFVAVPPPLAPIVSQDPFHKPAEKVVARTVEKHPAHPFAPVFAPRLSVVTLPAAAPIVSQDPFYKPAEKIVARTVEKHSAQPFVPVSPPRLTAVTLPAIEPIVSHDPFHKPAEKVVAHTKEKHQAKPFVPVSASKLPAVTLPAAAPIVSRDPILKPAEKVVARTVERHQPKTIESVFAPKTTPVTFRQAAPTPAPMASIVSNDPAHKPATKVMGHTIVSSGQPVSVPNITSNDPSDKPALKIVARSIQPGR